MLTSGYLICWNSRWLIICQVYVFQCYRTLQVMDNRVSRLLQNIDNTIISYDLCSDIHHINNLVFQAQLLIRHILVATIPDSIIESLWQCQF